MGHEEMICALERIIRSRKAAQRSVLSQSSLHVGQPAMLRFICNHPGCSQKQIADEVEVTPASVAASIKRMERAGLITRREDTADTRCNRVYMTPAGERELDFSSEALERVNVSMMNGISEEEQKLLVKLLEKMILNLRNNI